MHFKPNENGVSPVIAIILMISITVILAAVVASFVFGMTKNIPDSKMVTGSISHVDAYHVSVTYLGGADADTCVGVRWVVSTLGSSSKSSALMGSTSPAAPALQVGKTKTFFGHWTAKKRVIAIAYFKDGTSQIVLDNTE